MAQKVVKTTDRDGVISSIATEEAVMLLRRIVKLLEASGFTDQKGRQAVNIHSIGNTPTDVGTTLPVSGTVSANCTPVAGAINMGNVVMQFGAQATGAGSGVDSRFFMMDTARNAYANGIRSKLTWS